MILVFLKSLLITNWKKKNRSSDNDLYYKRGSITKSSREPHCISKAPQFPNDAKETTGENMTKE